MKCRNVFVLLSLSSLLTGFSCHPVATKTDQSLDLYWIDVEGGAATLLVTPAGESVLFDTGNPGDRDAGRIHRVATEVAGLKQIDHLVTTHFHIDHFGGAADLSRLMPIARIHDKGIPDALPEDPNFAQHIQPYRDIRTSGGHSLITPGYRLPLQKKAGRQPLSVSFLGADRIFVPIREGVGPGGGCGETAPKPRINPTTATAPPLCWNTGLSAFSTAPTSPGTWRRLWCALKTCPGPLMCFR